MAKNLFLAMSSLLMVVAVSACTAQTQIDRAFKSDLGFEKLYGSTAFSVYYDPIARQCVAYAIVALNEGAGIGLDTFACNPDELRSRAKDFGKEESVKE